MLSFKPKANKKIKICKKYSTTLDGKHKEFINEFTKDEFDTIPKLKEERYSLKKQLELETNLPIELIMEIKDRLKEINETIKQLKNKKNNYFLDNSKLIFEYFENKKNISNCTTVENETGATTCTTNDNVKNKSTILNKFFKIKETSEPDNRNDLCNNNNIVKRYLSNIDDLFFDINSYVYQTDICKYCN